jgi:hypothetical protein
MRHEVVRADQHGGQIRRELERLRQLLVEEIAHPATADGEVRVAHRRRRALREERRQTVGPSPVLTLGHA